MIAMAVVALPSLAFIVPHPVDMNEAHPGLHQAPGQQDRLAKDVPAITVANLCRLCTHVKGMLGGTSRDQVKRSNIIGIVREGTSGQAFTLPGKLVKQAAAILQTRVRELRARIQSTRRITWQVGITIDPVWIVAGAQESGVLARPLRADGRNRLGNHDE